MSYWRINGGRNGVRLDFPGVVRRVEFQMGASGSMAVTEGGTDVFSGVGASSGNITPALRVEYVDTSGNLQSAEVVNGVTSITGVAPFLVHFDASGTRSAVATTRSSAVLNVGYRFNYEEGLGTTWTYPEGAGLSKDEDVGPPISGRVFTTVGTRLVRVKARDSAGNEGTIALSVTVTAPPTPTLIPASAGSWPALTDNSHYTLEAGGDYRSWGSPPTTGRRNILFSKVGAGADPRLGTVSYDNRHGVNVAESGLDSLYTRNIRFLDCDIETLEYKWFGPQYCGVVRGRARNVTQISSQYIWDNDNSGSANLRLSMRLPRGCFLWDLAGPCLSLNGGAEAYVWIHAMYNSHYYGFDLQHSPTNNNSGAIARVYPHFSDYRYGRLTALAASTGLNAYVFMLGAQDFPDLTHTPVEFPESGAIAYATAENNSYGLRPNIYEMGGMSDCQFGSSGSVEPTVTAGVNRARWAGGGVNVGGRLSWLENIRVQRPSPSSSGRANVEQGGADIALRNIKWDMGAGQDANFTQASSAAPFDGPYIAETTNTRPIPTPF